MGSQEQPQWVVPSPQIPRTFGLLNIIFGILMLLAGIFTAGWYMIAPSFTKAIEQQVDLEQAATKARRETRIADLKSREEAAKTEQEKMALKVEREAVQATVEPPTPDFGDISGWDVLSDRRLAIYTFSEIGVAIVLNVLMIVAGAGLMAMKELGRRLSLWVAWLKILRWVVMTVAVLVLVMPITMERMNRAFAKMNAQAGTAGPTPAVNPAQVARIMAIAGAVLFVMVAVASSIYPALSLWFLTRPRARAACLPVLPKPETPEEPTQWS